MKKLIISAFVSVCFVGAAAAQTVPTNTASAVKTAETVAKKATPFRPTKDQIKLGQAFLKDKKLYVGEATGVYNDETRAALKGYQKSNGLDDNGKFDKPTLEKMGIALTGTQGGAASSAVKSATKTATNAASTAVSGATSGATSGVSEVTNAGTKAATDAVNSAVKRPPPFRANDDQIKAAQKILIDGKMLAGEQTATLDDPTREGLKKYQEANGLKVTGTLNPATLEKMGIALTAPQRANVAAQTAYDNANKKN